MVANAIVAFDGDPVIQKSLFAPNPIALCRKTVMQTMRAYRAGKAGQRLEDSRRAGLRLLGRPATAVTLGDIGPDASSAIPILELVSEEDSSRQVREAAGKALKKIRGR